MTKEAATIDEQDENTNEQLKNLLGFLDILIQIDLANRGDK